MGIWDMVRGVTAPKAPATAPKTPKGGEGAWPVPGGDVKPRDVAAPVVGSEQQEPAALVDRNPASWSKLQMFALVKENTARAQALGVIERAKVEVSESSAKSYEKLARGRLDMAEDGGGAGLAGVSRASFYPTRAAILWSASRAVQDARKRADVAQKAGDLGAAVLAALEAARGLDAIEAAQRAERPATHAAPRQTKRKSLPSSGNWQEFVWLSASPAPRAAIAAMWATGARPCEIEKGIDLHLTKHPRTGKDLILVTIPGGKVTKENGQPQRHLIIDASHPAGVALLDAMGGKKSATIQRRAATIKEDFKTLKKKLGVSVSAYSLRHQFGANVKAAMEPEMVAAALGHASAKTQGRYGSKRQAQKGGAGILRAEAVRPIRQVKPQPGPGPIRPEAARPARPGPAT